MDRERVKLLAKRQQILNKIKQYQQEDSSQKSCSPISQGHQQQSSPEQLIIYSHQSSSEPDLSVHNHHDDNQVLSPEFPTVTLEVPVCDDDEDDEQQIETPKTSTQPDDKFTQNYYLQKLFLIYGHKSSTQSVNDTPCVRVEPLLTEQCETYHYLQYEEAKEQAIKLIKKYDQHQFIGLPSRPPKSEKGPTVQNDKQTRKNKNQTVNDARSSQYLMTDSSLRQFLERQTEFMINKETKIKQSRDLKSQENKFEPAINPVSQAIASYSSESATPNVYQRLTEQKYTSSKGDSREQLTYVPSIDNISKKIAYERDSLKELPRFGKKLSAKQLQYLQERDQACTFKPQILDQDLPHYPLIQKTQDSLASRDKWIREQATIKSQQELEHCTFKPEVGPQQVEKENTISVSQVKGLERFLMLKDMQRRQQDEKALREKQVFRDGSSYTKSKGIKTEEFVFRTQQRIAEKEELDKKDYKHKFVRN